MNVRDIAVAVVIGILKLGKGVVVRWTLYAHVVNLNLLMRLQIVVHDHATAADDGHFANFSRLQPTALDGRETLVSERERHVGNVFDIRGNMGVSLAIYRHGKFAQDVQDDRDIVGSEIPGYINVFLEQAQVQPS